MVSVVTTLLFLQPPVEYEIQKNPDLSPYQWVTDCPKDLSFCIDNEELTVAFKVERNKYINYILNELQQEQTLNENGFTDYIDNLKVSEKCSKITDDSAYIKVTFDDSGKLKKEKFERSKDPYDNVESFVKGKTKATLIDPVFTNPCSYESIADIFRHASEISNREWIAVGCDGLPYLLGSRVIENHLSCPVCGLVVKKKELFVSHCATVHNITGNDIETNRVFKNILLIPGLGHFEINYVKAMFKLLWEVSLKDLAKMLGFRSLIALGYCERASNHHKSWAMLQIFFKAYSRELALPYVRHTLRIGKQPTVDGFFTFISSVKSPAFIFLFKAIFNFLFALDLFRKGVRRNNPFIISITMHQLSTLFFGLNMTSYMEIEVRRNIIQHHSPPEVKRLIEDMSSMSHSGHKSKGEGGDFILEGYNRKTKMWMPHGAANERRWLRVYRNLPDIEKIKDKFTDDDGEDEDEIEHFRNRDNTNEVAHWRKQIRLSDHLHNETKMTNMDGTKVLETDLSNFQEKCKLNKKRYCQAFPNSFKCERIFFTKDDRDKFFNIENKTKDEIAAKIKGLLNLILEDGGESEHDFLQDIWKKDVKKRNKKDYLEFYRECMQAHEEIQQKGDE